MRIIVFLSLLVQVTVALISPTTRADASYSLHMFGKKASKASGPSTQSTEATAAITIFRTNNAKSELKDAELSRAFSEITTLFKGDKASALLCFKNEPSLFISASRVKQIESTKSVLEKFQTGSSGSTSSIDTLKECFSIYEKKFGYEKALGLVTRNPR